MFIASEFPPTAFLWALFWKYAGIVSLVHLKKEQIKFSDSASYLIIGASDLQTKKSRKVPIFSSEFTRATELSSSPEPRQSLDVLPT